VQGKEEMGETHRCYSQNIMISQPAL